MTTPTGTISISQVNTELGRTSTTGVNIGLTAVRTLAGVPSGAISMSNLRGKSNATATGTMVAGVSGQFVGYSSASGYGSLTNSKPANPIVEFDYFTITAKTSIYTAISGSVPWSTNPTTVVVTMNGVTATLTWTTGNALNYYTVAGNVFNIVNGGSYSWSYK